MSIFSRLSLMTPVLLSVRAVFFLSAIVTWPILAELELFEQFYEFSRSHEDWDLDEFALLTINLTIALTVSSWHQSYKLKRLAADREFEHQRAEENARHDPLTGLANRRAFSLILEEKCRNTIENDGRFIAMIDLDKFKPVNDLHGHTTGDMVLTEVAERLVAETTTDGIVARLGGDEFAILFGTSVTARQSEKTCRRILGSISETFSFNGATMQVGCSIGLINWTSDLTSAEALGRADRALYSAKNQGRSQLAWYDADLDRQSIARAEIEADLREAIDKSEIEAWFQPIIQIDTQTLTGFEVLARWNHAHRGQIPPGVFIEIAEDIGQIGALGLSLLRKACQSASSWPHDLTISFNISPDQFRDPRLVENIQEILVDVCFDPKRLTLEITESAIIDDFDVARNQLNRLKALGISIALDDFGTGYSSLASLRQLPFDRIKIDRSFVTNISNETQNRKIVSGIMSLASGLELDVTAEGIETHADLICVQGLKCSLGQGFLFEKAVPADSVSWLLETSWSDLFPEETCETANGLRNVS